MGMRSGTCEDRKHSTTIPRGAAWFLFPHLSKGSWINWLSLSVPQFPPVLKRKQRRWRNRRKPSNSRSTSQNCCNMEFNGAHKRVLRATVTQMSSAAVTTCPLTLPSLSWHMFLLLEAEKDLKRGEFWSGPQKILLLCAPPLLNLPDFPKKLIDFILRFQFHMTTIPDTPLKGK